MFITFFTGILIGSFLNVCICRIPKGQSIAYPPSHCGKCEARLKPIDLIPILSYIFYKGKCRYCGGEISLQYPIVEFLNGILYLFLYNQYGYSPEFFKYAILISILIVISFIDLKEQIIPNRLNLLCLFVGLIYLVLYGSKWELVNSIKGLFLGGGIFLLIAIISNGAMGGGDIKLMGALGFCLGWRSILLVVLSSFIIGAVVSIFLLTFKIKGRKDYIPFGPFISVAAIMTITYGSELISLYLKYIV